jgi:hypothetical protein
MTILLTFKEDAVEFLQEICYDHFLSSIAELRNECTIDEIATWKCMNYEKCGAESGMENI